MHALYDALRLLFISAPAVAAGKRCTACTRQFVRTVSLRALRAVASDVQAADHTKSAIKTIHAIFMLSSLLQETMTDAYVRHMKTLQGSAIRSSSARRGIARARWRGRIDGDGAAVESGGCAGVPPQREQKKASGTGTVSGIGAFVPRHRSDRRTGLHFFLEAWTPEG
jgi:hypothetical protein